MTTTISRDGAVAVVRMGEPRGNALSFATLAVLEGVLAEVAGSDARALVLVGTGRVFCVGLDLRECALFQRAELRRYTDAFESFFEKLFTFPLPIVAAVNGHAIAGGAVMALACDLRVMAPEAELALNEVELGIPFPSMAFQIGRTGLPSSSQTEGLMLGKRFTAADAVGRRIAHEMSAHVERAAVDRAHAFTLRGKEAVTATKKALRREALEQARSHADDSRAAFVEAFLAEDARVRIRAVLDKLERRV